LLIRKCFSVRNIFKERIVTRLLGGDRGARQMPIIKLFNGEEFTGDIIDDGDSTLVLEDSTRFPSHKRVIPKRDIFSINF